MYNLTLKVTSLFLGVFGPTVLYQQCHCFLVLKKLGFTRTFGVS